MWLQLGPPHGRRYTIGVWHSTVRFGSKITTSGVNPIGSILRSSIFIYNLPTLHSGCVKVCVFILEVLYRSLLEDGCVSNFRGGDSSKLAGGSKCSPVPPGMYLSGQNGRLQLPRSLSYSKRYPEGF